MKRTRCNCPRLKYEGVKSRRKKMQLISTIKWTFSKFQSASLERTGRGEAEKPVSMLHWLNVSKTGLQGCASVNAKLAGCNVFDALYCTQTVCECAMCNMQCTACECRSVWVCYVQWSVAGTANRADHCPARLELQSTTMLGCKCKWMPQKVLRSQKISGWLKYQFSTCLVLVLN